MIRSFISLAGRKNGEYVSKNQKRFLQKYINDDGKFIKYNWLVEADENGVTAIYYRSTLIWSKDDGWREAYKLRELYLEKATFHAKNLLLPEDVLKTLKSLELKNSGYFKTEKQADFILNQPCMFDPLLDDEFKAALKKQSSILARFTFADVRYYLNEAGIVMV